MTKKGRVLLLQGPSSAGKSTLARAMQRTFQECWWQVEADDVTRMWPMWQPSGWWEPSAEERPHGSWNPDVRLRQWLDVYWNAIALVAGTGANVIAVGGWLKTEWLVQAAHAFDGLDALCVGVYCPLEECERREIARGDRGPGYARSMYKAVFEHAPFDIDVYTHAMSADEAARHIEAEMSKPRDVPFFERIRREHPKQAA